MTTATNGDGGGGGGARKRPLPFCGTLAQLVVEHRRVELSVPTQVESTKRACRSTRDPNHAVNSFAGHQKNDSVATPRQLYELLNAEFRFTHDPCPMNRVEGADGLVDAWGERNFVNPPYSSTDEWVKKAVDEMHTNRRLSVLLIPFRSCSYYWDEWIWDNAREVRMFTKRMRFVGYKATFPVPMCIVVFDPACAQPCALQRITTPEYSFRVIQTRENN
jgi:hypothetical protein